MKAYKALERGWPFMKCLEINSDYIKDERGYVLDKLKTSNFYYIRVEVFCATLYKELFP